MWLVSAALVSCGVVGSDVPALELTITDSAVVITGEFRPKDENAFRVVKNAGYLNGKTVVFRDMRGGYLGSAVHIGKDIRDARVNTRVEGVCASACLAAFIGGVERTAGDSPAGVALHRIKYMVGGDAASDAEAADLDQQGFADHVGKYLAIGSYNVGKHYVEMGIQSGYELAALANVYPTPKIDWLVLGRDEMEKLCILTTKPECKVN
jgi:hypothetical protein